MTLRVCQLVTELDPGGAERIVYELATGLDPHRFPQVVVSLQPASGEVARWLADRGLRVRSLQMRSKLDLTAGRRLARVLRDEGVQLLNTHLFHASYLGGRSAGAAGVRCLVATVHGFERGRPWRDWIERRGSRAFDRVVCVSEAVRREVALRRGVPEAKLRVIHNGVDVARFVGPFDRASTRRSLGVPLGARLLASVGRLRHDKGHDVVLRAFALVSPRAPDVRLALVGDGPARPALHRLARRLGVADRVVFAGHRDDVPAILACADCFAAASRSEGFGIAACEAMAAGRPVVATAVDALAELIEDGVSGVLVPPGDFALLAEAALSALHDPSRAAAMGLRARARVAERFPLRGMLAAYEALYAELE